MSKHWRPSKKIVPIGAARARRDWARASSYGGSARRGRTGSGPSGTVVGLVLTAAACAGVAIGLSQGGGVGVGEQQHGAAIEWGAAQGVPRAETSAEDRAWARRAAAPARGAESDWAPDQVRGDEADVRRAFGLCHSGVGTDCVVDGDTFYIGGDKVRIAGIDAPETHPPRCAEEAQLGEAATEKLRALLNSGAVTMTGTDRNRDAYGRLLRNVAVDGVDVGEAMIGAGVARDYAGGRRSWCG